MRPDGGPAFPIGSGQVPSPGMSLRAWLAGLAMQAIITLDGAADCTPKEVAHDAIMQADALIAELEKDKNRIDWEGFGQAVMEAWPDGDIDGFELQEIAERHGVISQVPGGYDPERDGEDAIDEYGIEPGDAWFVRNYERKDDHA